MHVSLPEMLLSNGFAVALNVLPAERFSADRSPPCWKGLLSWTIWAIATELPKASTIAAICALHFTISMFVIIRAAARYDLRWGSA